VSFSAPASMKVAPVTRAEAEPNASIDAVSVSLARPGSFTSGVNIFDFRNVNRFESFGAKDVRVAQSP
jgi:hypothetical protein